MKLTRTDFIFFTLIIGLTVLFIIYAYQTHQRLHPPTPPPVQELVGVVEHEVPHVASTNVIEPDGHRYNNVRVLKTYDNGNLLVRYDEVPGGLSLVQMDRFMMPLKPVVR